MEFITKGKYIREKCNVMKLQKIAKRIYIIHMIGMNIDSLRRILKKFSHKRFRQIRLKYSLDKLSIKCFRIRKFKNNIYIIYTQYILSKRIMYIMYKDVTYISYSLISIFISGKVHTMERHFCRNENSIRKKERTKVQQGKLRPRRGKEDERDKKIDRH